MVDRLHTKRIGLLLEIPTYTAHAQDSEHLAFWIVTKWRCWIASPLALSESEHRSVEPTQSTQDQEDVDVGSCIVHGCWYV